ncbi:hypothetical protein GUJ93_ZPchr0003g16468 [Zizania palustris]|uniref:Uncharacterized protein n=1 Tax=Zizania palustris TaxID=103762 RepID=A0A8J5S9G8_ZIZPA|nr:hypothetical protein GUJ93_ZPchr0003g16468 [Zizania palustris]
MSRSIRRRTRLTFPWHRRSPPPRASSRRRRPPPPIYSPPRHPALSPSAVRCPRAPSSCGGGGGRRRRVQRESASRGARSRLLQSCVKEIGEEILTGPNLTIRVGEYFVGSCTHGTERLRQEHPREGIVVFPCTCVVNSVSYSS